MTGVAIGTTRRRGPERLVRSTEELLRDPGYVGTSPEAIQAHARAGQGGMYHRFAGKSDLALAAIRRSAEQVRAEAEAALSGKGTARDRIAAYLSRERDILRGCPAGRPAQDPEIVAGAELWQPVHETFGRLRERLAAVVTEGKAHGEFASKPDPAHLAASIAAVVQNGYVPARAAGSVEPFDRAAEGVRELLQTA